MSAEARIDTKKATILTPNAALAQRLRRKRLIDSKVHAAPSASIYVLQNWLTESIQPELPIATDNQLRFIWQQVIAEQRDKNELLQQLNPTFLASQALNAWRCLKRFQISFDELATAETGQLLSFKKWVIAFEAKLASANLTSLDLELSNKLKEPCSRKPLAKLYAFIDSPPPLWTAWLEHNFDVIEHRAFSESGGKAESEKTASAQICALRSDEDELVAALNWAASITAETANARIAIIDTQLDDHLKTVKRLSESILDTAHTLNPINISYSRQVSLADEGPVATALKLLALNDQQIDLASARHICQSRLWGVDKESEQQALNEYSFRANWDKAICALQSSRISSSDFIALISDESSTNLKRTFADRRRSKLMSPLDWCDHFQGQLEQLGCFQHFDQDLWQRWADALGDFAQLSSISGQIAISDAIRYLKHSCSSSHAQSNSSKPGITFLDTIEAAANSSHIWLLGMDHTSWPGSPQFNPLLPASLQIQHGMPRSQPQMEAELAKRLIERVTQSADEVVFSYSQFKDNLEQSPCTFISDLPELDLAHFINSKNATNSELKSNLAELEPNLAMEWVDCSSAPKVPEQHRQVRGGAGLLKTMSSSPFNAFVRWRLGAYELDTPKIGLSALDRGNLAHNLLESLWRELGDSNSLSTLDNTTTIALCREHADKELKRFQARNGWLKQAYAELEAERLATLAKDWLEVEKQRSEFSVELTEEGLSANLAGLKFNMRLDRLDRLSNGKRLLIDYKTSKSLSRSYWLDQPPAEPQLPLYALTLETAPDAICFAKVRSDKMEFIGICSENVGSDISGIKTVENWQELIGLWKSSLEQLATDYINGDTRVFETQAGFGYADPLTPIHRFPEALQIEQFKEETK